MKLFLGNEEMIKMIQGRRWGMEDFGPFLKKKTFSYEVILNHWRFLIKWKGFNGQVILRRINPATCLTYYRNPAQRASLC